MDLILWRYADAEDGMPDDARILVSPAKRAQQTASALGREFETGREVGTGASVVSAMAAAGWPDAKGAVVVVGHQPALRRIAAVLLSGVEADWSIKKAGVWWFSSRLRDDETQTVLRAVMSPEYF